MSATPDLLEFHVRFEIFKNLRCNKSIANKDYWGEHFGEDDIGSRLTILLEVQS